MNPLSDLDFDVDLIDSATESAAPSLSKEATATIWADTMKKFATEIGVEIDAVVIRRLSKDQQRQLIVNYTLELFKRKHGRKTILASLKKFGMSDENCLRVVGFARKQLRDNLIKERLGFDPAAIKQRGIVSAIMDKDAKTGKPKHSDYVAELGRGKTKVNLLRAVNFAPYVEATRAKAELGKLVRSLTDEQAAEREVEIREQYDANIAAIAASKVEFQRRVDSINKTLNETFNTRQRGLTELSFDVDMVLAMSVGGEIEDMDTDEDPDMIG